VAHKTYYVNYVIVALAILLDYAYKAKGCVMDISANNETANSKIEQSIIHLAINDNSQKYHCFKIMDATFKFCSTSISDYNSSECYLTECLSNFIQDYGLINSKSYIDTFYSICKNAGNKSKIEELINSIKANQENCKAIVYKTINNYNLSAYLFYPSNFIQGNKYPAIAIFHGGGWDIGNPSWAFGQAYLFKNEGMIGIAVQYRLSNKIDISPIDSMQDAKDLIKWLRNNADSLGIQTDKIAAAGWSAGAHLAASCAVFPDNDQQNSSKPDALSLTSPAVDLSDDKDEDMKALLSKTNVDPLNISPIEFITEGLPPTILLHGRDDSVAHLAGVQLYHDRMVNKGNNCELCIFDNVGHLFTPSYLDDSGIPQPDWEVQKKADQKAIEFLRKLKFIK
jgi:acetyl esterase/lipase